MRPSDRNVLFQRSALLLQLLPANIANVAHILFIAQECISLISETTEGIDHDTWNDVAKQNLEKCEVHNIVDVPDYLELLHSLADDPCDV